MSERAILKKVEKLLLDASKDWLDGWDLCKADVGKLKAASAAERRGVEQMVMLFRSETCH